MSKTQIVILKEVATPTTGDAESFIETYFEKEYAQDELKKKVSKLVIQGAFVHIQSDDVVHLMDIQGNKRKFTIYSSNVKDRSNAIVEKLKNLSKEDILKRYASFESLCAALDSCFDLHSLGYADKLTQKNYEALASLQAIDLWAQWKQAHGKELY